VQSLDIVVPAYNEEAGLEAFYARLRPVLDGLDLSIRVLFVDDGSTDRTAAVCQELAASDPRVGLLRLSRNFGHQAALTAGLDHVSADAVITMDSDLQHPPEALPEFVAAWRAGAEVVSGVRANDSQTGFLKRTTSALFYRFLNLISSFPITPDSPDFRLLDRKVVRAIGQLREQSRFLRGIYAWVGFKQASEALLLQARLDVLAEMADEPLPLADHLRAFRSVAGLAPFVWR
jgi:glycosyltransferase involved in cell wall biosynthesis